MIRRPPPKSRRTIAGLALALPLGLAGCAELLPLPADDSCANVCPANASATIIGCDDRAVQPPSTDGTEEEPWRFTGRFDGGSTCTGTLIAPDYVLTAAHCMENQGSAQLGFALAQEAQAFSGRPFGTVGVAEVFIPQAYQRTDSEVDRSFDLAVARLTAPIAGAETAEWGRLPWDSLRTRPPFTAGYPGSRPDGGILGRPWIVGGQPFPASQPFRWLDGGASGLLYTTLDGSGGQSGSPVYVALSPTERRVVGVLIGSPQAACLADQMWVSRLTPDVVEHIQNLMEPNTIDFWWDTIAIPSSPTAGPGQTWP